MPGITKLSHDELIKLVNDLKNALVQRELRIGQLELQLSKALVGVRKISASEIEKSLLPPVPPPASHPYSFHLSAESQGLYSDGWVSPSAKLVFHPSSSDGHYQVQFWLPKNAEARPMVLKSISGETTTLNLSPDQITPFKFSAPPDGLSPATIWVETSPFVSSSDDKRNLGVILLKIQWTPSDGASAVEK